MSNNKRKFAKTRESFNNIISDTTPTPTPPTHTHTANSSKKRKTQSIRTINPGGGSEEGNIQKILEEIL